MMNEQVREIMTKDPMVASPEATIAELSEMMLKNKVQQLPVVAEGKLLGMITSYDLWNNLRNSANAENRKVSDVMIKDVIKITPLDKVGTAAELFMDKRFKTLPVVNLRNELKGVVTSFDVMRHALSEEYPQPILYKEVFKDQ